MFVFSYNFMIEWKINNYPNYKDCNLSKTVFTMTKSSVPSSQQESITYTHSLNLDDTSKGLRISVHVFEHELEFFVLEVSSNIKG